MKKTTRRSSSETMILLIHLPVILTTLTKLISGDLINFPFHCTNLENIKYSNLSCPTVWETFKIKTGDKVERGSMCRPSLHTHDLEEGYLCYKDTWTTTCDESWYFSTEVKYKIIHEEVHDIDCLDALIEYKVGKLKAPFFPVATCYWASSTTESITFMMIKPHNAPLDPYSNRIVDPIIQADSGDNLKIYRTTFPKTRWIREVNTTLEERCNVATWECHDMTLYSGWLTHPSGAFKTSLRTGLVVDSQIMGHILLRDTCKMDFCGRRGFRFPDGGWWRLTTENEVSLQDFELNDTVVPKCDDRSRNHVGYTDLDYNPEKIALEQKSLLKTTMCREKLAELGQGKGMSLYDTTYLIPNAPGRYPAYYIYPVGLNKTLETQILKEKTISNPLTAKRKEHMPIMLYMAQCHYTLIEFPNLDSTGTLRYTSLEDPVGTILESGKNVSLADLGFEDINLDNTTCKGNDSDCFNTTTPKEPLLDRKFNMTNHTLPWRRYSKRELHHRVTYNGITHSPVGHWVQIPYGASLTANLPEHLIEKHSTHFFDHVTKQSIFERELQNGEISIDDLEQLIGRKTNHTDLPKKVRNWVQNAKESVVGIFREFGHTIRLGLSIVSFLIGLIISFKVWKKCRKNKKETQQQSRSSPIYRPQNIYELEEGPISPPPLARQREHDNSNIFRKTDPRNPFYSR
ncbi:G protein [Ekpoma virus 1]|uniref:G protein n=1 Tax=Ekpoma virus 1 TaxID=1987020 RepID=A0A0C5CF22_9RHAB|nr:G protein [Ekpoma virus 1]AJN08915.1 G protein [Ekpoma virus 1]